MTTKQLQYNTLAMNQLDTQDAALLAKAREALDHAYAPYSKFQVGAAVLLDNGEVVTGSNQENAAYPSGLCAERVALFYAQHKYPQAKVKALAIAAKNDGEELVEPVMPCGACVQVMSETVKRYGQSFRVLLGAKDHVIALDDAMDFIPFRFEL